MFNGHTIPARKMKLKCRCPRVNGVKTCGWTYKRNLLTTDQFNSITCNPDDYTCSDPNLIFNDGCNLLEWQTADPTCTESGSHNNHGCHPMNPMCGMNKPTNGSVSLSNYAIYQTCQKSACS